MVTDWKFFFSIVSVVVSSLAFLPYLWDTWHIKPQNDTRPTIAGIGCWVLSDGAILAAMIANGVIEWLMVPYVVGGVLVIAFGMRKNFLIAQLEGVESKCSDIFAGWSRTDSICLGFVVSAIVVWGIARNPDYAIYLTVGSIVLGTWAVASPLARDPYKEPLFAWILFLIGGVFGVLAVKDWSSSSSIPPALFCVIQLTIVLLALRRYLPRFAAV